MRRISAGALRFTVPQGRGPQGCETTILLHKCGLLREVPQPTRVIHEKRRLQPSPQFQADRPQSVKVYGHIEGHSNLMLMLILLQALIRTQIKFHRSLIGNG
jgi:hypothetical protein